MFNVPVMTLSWETLNEEEVYDIGVSNLSQLLIPVTIHTIPFVFMQTLCKPVQVLAFSTLDWLLPMQSDSRIPSWYCLTFLIGIAL
jgi:hypothetical protein